METKQWGFPYGDVEAYVDTPPGHARNKFIVIGDELNHVAYIPSIHPEAKKIVFLVKAAPDLLAALEEIKTWLVAPATDQETIEHFREVVEQPIAKARGQA
jgi:hypothetical protein